MHVWRCYLENCWLSYKGLLPARGRLSALLLERVLNPVLELLMVSLMVYFMLGPGAVCYVLIGNIVYLSAWGGMFSLVGMMRNERRARTLSIVLASPTPLAANLTQKLRAARTWDDAGPGPAASAGSGASSAGMSTSRTWRPPKSC